MSEPALADALVTKIVEGNAPRHVKLAAARGALPLPRGTLVRLFVILLADEAEDVGGAARSSLDGVGAEELRAVLSEPDCAVEVLSHFAGPAARQEELAECIVFHRHTPDAALDTLAEKGHAATIDLLLTNQERLLRRPALLDRLMNNGALRPDQRGRLLEFVERAARLAATGAAGAEEDAVAEPSAQELQEAARLLDVDIGELLSASEILGGEEIEESDDPAVRTAYQRILTLTTAQKAILALKGGREERLILIRDSNKVVSLGVLKNPRISELEVESIARMRNVTDEVLRLVGTHREWVRNYPVVKALVNNPRTPQMISTNFVQRLAIKDLKMLASSREVPELIRRMAKRTLETRTQRTTPFGRKKR